MKRKLTAVLCVLLCILTISGCGIVSGAISALRRAVRDTPAPAETYTQRTSSPTEDIEPYETPKPLDSPEPLPSQTVSTVSGNRSDIAKEELLQHFRQVVYGADQTLTKWTDQLVISMSGDYDQPDEEQATNIYDMLNEYDGFPGAVFLEAAGKGAKANVEIQFLTPKAMMSAVPDWDGETPCYADFWTDDNDKIYKAVIYMVPEREENRANRNCDLTWGIFYTLGFCNDCGMYYDSLFNPDYYAEALGRTFQGPCAADWQLVPMLYNKAVKPGMTYSQAAAALPD